LRDRLIQIASFLGSFYLFSFISLALHEFFHSLVAEALGYGVGVVYRMYWLGRVPVPLYGFSFVELEAPMPEPHAALISFGGGLLTALALLAVDRFGIGRMEEYPNLAKGMDVAISYWWASNLLYGMVEGSLAVGWLSEGTGIALIYLTPVFAGLVMVLEALDLLVV